MIHPKELNEKSALETKSAAYLSEFNSLESKFDGHIKKGEMNLLKGEKIHFTIHDSQNEYGSLNDVITKYKEAGWDVKLQRSWSALFVDVYLGTFDRNGI